MRPDVTIDRQSTRARLDRVFADHCLTIDLAIDQLQQTTSRALADFGFQLDRRCRVLEEQHQRQIGPWYLTGDIGLRWFETISGYTARRVLVGPGARSFGSPTVRDDDAHN